MVQYCFRYNFHGEDIINHQYNDPLFFSTSLSFYVSISSCSFFISRYLVIYNLLFYKQLEKEHSVENCVSRLFLQY